MILCRERSIIQIELEFKAGRYRLVGTIVSVLSVGMLLTLFPGVARARKFKKSSFSRSR